MVLSIIPGLITMSVVDWTMTREYKTHASGLFLRSDTRGIYVDIHVTMASKPWHVTMASNSKNLKVIQHGERSTKFFYKKEWKTYPNKYVDSRVIPELSLSKCDWLIWFIVFNATLRNISAISWWPVLVVEEAGVPGENHRPWASNW